MPQFELVPLVEAKISSATGKRAQIAREYLSYIAELGEGQAGRLQPAEGESITAVRRRLGRAAKLAGRGLVIKRSGDELYFRSGSEEGPTRRRRGRSSEGTDD